MRNSWKVRFLLGGVLATFGVALWVYRQWEAGTYGHSMHEMAPSLALHGPTQLENAMPTGATLTTGRSKLRSQFQNVTSQVSGTDTTAPDYVGAESHDDESKSVVGRPFPISGALRARCLESVGTTCESLLLREFPEQPRDQQWSDRMEAKLRDVVINVEPGKYWIGEIECRTTLCVVEVSSHSGAFKGAYLYVEPYDRVSLYADLLSVVNVSTRTPVHDAEPITSTLVIYRRR